MKQKQIKLSDLRMRAEIVPKSLNEENRTVDIIWSTGSRVKRYHYDLGEYYWEELSLDPLHVRLGRLNNGAPFLWLHNSFDTERRDVLGVIVKGSAKIENNLGIAKVRFSKREDVEPVFIDIKDGILQHISVGYNVYKMIELEDRAEDGLKILKAVDWEPLESSLVPIGADDNSVVRNKQENSHLCEITILEERKMDPKQEAQKRAEEEAKASEEAKKAEEAKAAEEAKKIEEAKESERAKKEEEKISRAKEEGVKIEQERCKEIIEICEHAKLDRKFSDKLINDKVSIEDARNAVIDHLADLSDRTKTSTARVEVISMEKQVRIEGCINALMNRANPKTKLQESGKEFRGMNMMDMARDCIEAAGGKTRGLSRREIAVISLNLDRIAASRAGMHTSSDFPEILANTVSRSLRSAYELAPKTFMPWCRMAVAPDFKEMARVQMSEMSQFQSIKESGEYKRLTFGDSVEKYSLAKTGGIIAITWESIINDDLSAFDRIPVSLAEEAAATENEIVYNILSGNPLMNDGKPLFHSAHGNLASSGSAIASESLSSSRASMRKQKGKKGRTLRIVPSFLIVGPDNELDANKYTSAQFVAAKASDINPNFNTSLQVIVEPLITGNEWYLAADPARLDTIEYAYLEGENGLFIERRDGFEVDGIEIKARHVFAAKALEWTTLYKNPGASS